MWCSSVRRKRQEEKAEQVRFTQWVVGGEPWWFTRGYMAPVCQLLPDLNFLWLAEDSHSVEPPLNSELQLRLLDQILMLRSFSLSENIYIYRESGIKWFQTTCGNCRVQVDPNSCYRIDKLLSWCHWFFDSLIFLLSYLFLLKFC